MFVRFGTTKPSGSHWGRGSLFDLANISLGFVCGSQRLKSQESNVMLREKFLKIFFLQSTCYGHVGKICFVVVFEMVGEAGKCSGIFEIIALRNASQAHSASEMM